MTDRARNKTDKELEKMERRLTEIYQKAAHDIAKKWDSYMEKAQKRIETYEKDLIDAQKVGDDKIIAQMEKRLSDAKMNVTLRDTHYKKMLDAVTDQLAKVNQTALDYINEEVPKIYAWNYNQAGEIAQQVGIKFNLINEQTVKTLINDGVEHMDTLRKKLNKEKDKKWNQKQINSVLLQGIIQGESIQKMSGKIFSTLQFNGEFKGMTEEQVKALAKENESVKSIIRKNRNAAIRNARTMTTGAENRGRNDSYRQLEQDGLVLTKVWMATPDGRTRDWHIDMDGQEVKIEESFIDGLGNELEYPGDPMGEPATIYNCRCTMVTDVKGFRNADGSISEIAIHDADTEHEEAIDKELAKRGDK